MRDVTQLTSMFPVSAPRAGSMSAFPTKDLGPAHSWQTVVFKSFIVKKKKRGWMNGWIDEWMDAWMDE